MSNFIIECKNKTAIALNPNQPNGQYNIQIQDKIALVEGDTIVMKSCFIDTESVTEQKVVVVEDITLTMNYIHYVMNNIDKADLVSESTFTYVQVGVPDKTEPDPVCLDGRLYLRTKPGKVYANGRQLVKITFVNLGAGDWGGFNAWLHYYDLEGVFTEKSFYIPVQTQPATVGGGGVSHDYYCLYDEAGGPVSISTNRQGYTAVTLLSSNTGGTKPSYLNTIVFGVVLGSFPNGTNWSQDIGSASVYTAIPYSSTIVVPIGNYEPADLCEVINRQLNKVGSNGSPTNMVDNNFLVQNDDTQLFINPNPTSAPSLSAQNFVNNDYRFTKKTAAFLGASQMTLGFNDATKAFGWEYYHTPYYSNAGEVSGFMLAESNFEQVSQYPTAPAATDVRQVTSYSGILFTSLISEQANNTSTNFWTDILGFNIDSTHPDSIVVNLSQDINGAQGLGIAGRSRVFKPVLTPPEVGVKRTGNYLGIASTVQTAKAAFNIAPVFSGAGSASGYSLATATLTTLVSAKDSIIQDNFGYFVIEVQANFQNNFITTDENRRNVMAVVSKYYQQSSYTSGTQDSSLVYTHVGEPTILSSFNIRILDSDKNLVKNLGEDTTVFLNVIKAPPQPTKKSS